MVEWLEFHELGPRGGDRSAAVEVTDHGGPFCRALGPVATGHVGAGNPAARAADEGRPVGSRAREDVVLVWRLGRSLGALPFSSSTVSLLMLFASECNSARLRAMSTPLMLYQGPVPMRSRALTKAGLLSAGACALR
jgi:hypothetical protein